MALCVEVVEPFKLFLRVTAHPQFMALRLRVPMGACLRQYSNSIICHCLLFHEHGKQTLCSYYFSEGSYYGYKYTWTELHNEIMS